MFMKHDLTVCCLVSPLILVVVAQQVALLTQATYSQYVVCMGVC